MSLSIGSNPSVAQSHGPHPAAADPAFKEAWKDLAKSLKSDDLAGARQAYKAVIQNAPDGATLTRGSPFVQMGKALVGGDLDAAKVAFASMVRSKVEDRSVTLPPGGSGPVSPMAVVPSSTGGGAGTVLNVSA